MKHMMYGSNRKKSPHSILRRHLLFHVISGSVDNAVFVWLQLAVSCVFPVQGR